MSAVVSDIDHEIIHIIKRFSPHLEL